MTKREKRLDNALRSKSGGRVWLAYAFHRGRGVWAAACGANEPWMYTLTDGTTCLEWWTSLDDAERNAL